MNNFIKSRYTLDDLEQFRDKDGFIDLTKTDIKITQESREKRGTAERMKNWVDLAGKKVLLRGQPEDIENYSMYAELIIEEIAKELGIENAHYDLIKTKDNNGKEITGVLSVAIMDMDKEELISLHDLVGDEENTLQKEITEIDELDDMCVTNYDFTIEKLAERLTKGGYSEEEIRKLMLDYKKRLIFYLSVLDADKHPENISFIKSIKGNDKIRISPNYDSEFSLLLELDQGYCKYISENMFEVEKETDNDEFRIGIIVPEEEGGWNNIWKDTLEKLIEDDELYDYYNDNMRGKIDMKVIFERVEKRIHAPMPNVAKIVAQRAYESRNRIIEKIMDGEITPGSALSEEYDLKSEIKYMSVDEKANDKTESLIKMLSGFIEKGKKTGITTEEQLKIGKIMQEDIEQSRKKENSISNEEKAIDDIEMD